MSEGFDLGGESTTTAKFDNVGDSVTGTVVSMTERQSTKLGSLTNEPDFWPDGKPKMYYQVILQTDLRTDGNDDGKRSIALTGSRKSSEQSSLSAVLDAINKIAPGSTELKIGARLTLTMIGTMPPRTPGFNPRKLYSAACVPTAISLGVGPHPTTEPNVPTAAAAAPPPAQASPQFSAEQIEAMRQAGVDVSAFVTA